jgi:hypothetical protein
MAGGMDLPASAAIEITHAMIEAGTYNYSTRWLRDPDDDIATEMPAAAYRVMQPFQIQSRRPNFQNDGHEP